MAKVGGAQTGREKKSAKIFFFKGTRLSHQETNKTKGFHVQYAFANYVCTGSTKE
jgi:hypothetical protein